MVPRVKLIHPRYLQLRVIGGHFGSTAKGWSFLDSFCDTVFGLPPSDLFLWNEMGFERVVLLMFFGFPGSEEGDNTETSAE